MSQNRNQCKQTDLCRLLTDKRINNHDEKNLNKPMLTNIKTTE